MSEVSTWDVCSDADWTGGPSPVQGVCPDMKSAPSGRLGALILSGRTPWTRNGPPVRSASEQTSHVDTADTRVRAVRRPAGRDGLTASLGSTLGPLGTGRSYSSAGYRHRPWCPWITARNRWLGHVGGTAGEDGAGLRRGNDGHQRVGMVVGATHPLGDGRRRPLD